MGHDCLLWLFFFFLLLFAFNFLFSAIELISQITVAKDMQRIDNQTQREHKETCVSNND